MSDRQPYLARLSPPSSAAWFLRAFTDLKCAIGSLSRGLCTGETLARGLLLRGPVLLTQLIAIHVPSSSKMALTCLGSLPAPPTGDLPQLLPLPTWFVHRVCACTCGRQACLSALLNCELQSVRKKKSSRNPSYLATRLAQGNSSSFTPKNGLDCRLGRRLVPCGI